MWKCTKCNLEINANLTYPVHCACGWTDHGNGKVAQRQINNPQPENNKIELQQNNQSEPNILQKAQNFGKAVVKHAQNGFINVATNIKQERLDICKSCEFYNSTNPDNPTCNKCGCFLKIKTGWASEKCPIGKWSDIKTQSNGGCGCNKKQETQ